MYMVDVSPLPLHVPVAVLFLYSYCETESVCESYLTQVPRSVDNQESDLERHGLCAEAKKSFIYASPLV